MARLDEMRSRIVPATPTAIAAIPAQAEVVIEAEGDDEDWGPDEETFDDALDMMETSYKLLGNLLLKLKMTPATRAIIENHRYDLKFFVDEWQAPILEAERA